MELVETERLPISIPTTSSKGNSNTVLHETCVRDRSPLSHADITTRTRTLVAAVRARVRKPWDPCLAIYFPELELAGLFASCISHDRDTPPQSSE